VPVLRLFPCKKDHAFDRGRNTIDMKE